MKNITKSDSNILRKDSGNKKIEALKDIDAKKASKNVDEPSHVKKSGKRTAAKVPEKHDAPDEIKSLKELEEKILEKYEDHKPQPDTKPSSGLKVEPVIDTIKEKKSKDNTEYKARVEAILFAIGKYLDEESISQLCEMDKRGVKKVLEELREDYDKRDTALMIVQEGNSWKINVREKYLSIVRKIVSDTELSKSIMETLAVIAWKTPIYQNEVVKIRGNKCYDHIEELVNSGFVTKDKKGRSYVLKTTEKFYNYFDIDQKNLQGVMGEAKLPTAQTTLVAEDKPEEHTYSREKLIHALETIETKSIVQTEEDKSSQKEFLENMHKKIEDSAKRTDEVIGEIPRPMHQQEQVIQAEVPPPDIHNDSISSKDEEIIIDTGTGNDTNHFQKPDEQPQKIKQLTKKQLEKKFKEELQRVKDKGKKE